MAEDEEDPWKSLTSVDDLVLPADRVIIADVERETTIHCPHLRKLGDYFYYCGGGIPEDTALELEPSNQIIAAHQCTAQIQLHCVDRYNACCHYRGTLPFPGASLVKPRQ